MASIDPTEDHSLPGSFFSRLEGGNGQQEVRTVLIDGEPWFVAKDVCNALGLADANVATQGLDEDEKLVHEFHRSAQRRQMVIISESGFYTLTIRSRKPSARQGHNGRAPQPNADNGACPE